MHFDLILRDGQILDGNGGEPFAGSVGVRGDRIEAVGDLADAFAARELDCSGRTIAPGFIDMHSHSDWVLPQADHGKVLAPLVEQGITTLVGGNCGCSPAPRIGRNERLLPSLGRMLHDRDLDYSWSSMGEFLAGLEAGGLALNLAQLVGHGTLRAAVKGGETSAAAPREVDEMADLARVALDQGAIGISTGLGYAPGVFASQDELIGVTRPLAERGGVYTSHARSYVSHQQRGATSDLPSNITALDETAAVCRAHGVPVQHSHLIFVGDVTWPTTDRALEHLEDLVDEGIDIAWDAFPYVGGNTTLIVFLPPWALVDTQAKLANAAQRERVAGSLERMQESFGMRWEDTQILWVPDPARAHYEGLSVAQIARERGQSGTDAYLDLVVELGAQTRIINWNYSGRDDEEASLRKVLSHSRTCFETDTILTGNGFDNPASYGTFPRILGRYVRELGLFSLPEAVRRMTSLSADRMGLRDCGRVERGLAADLVVFDPETVGDNTTRREPDRSPTGIEFVVQNGVTVLEQGAFDVASRAGRVLRLA
jgi:N-acyl-D-amino-acid deacylase